MEREHPEAPKTDVHKLLAERWKQADAVTKAKCAVSGGAVTTVGSGTFGWAASGRYEGTYKQNKAKYDEAMRLYTKSGSSKQDEHK